MPTALDAPFPGSVPPDLEIRPGPLLPLALLMYLYLLVPTPEQESLLSRHAGCVRFVWTRPSTSTKSFGFLAA